MREPLEFLQISCKNLKWSSRSKDAVFLFSCSNATRTTKRRNDGNKCNDAMPTTTFFNSNFIIKQSILFDENMADQTRLLCFFLLVKYRYPSAFAVDRKSWLFTTYKREKKRVYHTPTARPFPRTGSCVISIGTLQEVNRIEHKVLGRIRRNNKSVVFL